MPSVLALSLDKRRALAVDKVVTRRKLCGPPAHENGNSGQRAYFCPVARKDDLSVAGERRELRQQAIGVLCTCQRNQAVPLFMSGSRTAKGHTSTESIDECPYNPLDVVFAE